ncbi:MAG TPA: amidase [Nocardioidaceae bacterium]|nr:amidase [Nocardioidaceae bacterium]
MTRDSLLGQLDALKSGEVTSKELTEAALKEAESTQSSLNAFKLITSELARAQAAEADDARARGEDKPLLGIPIVIKDDTDLAGTPTAFGCVGDFPDKTEDAEVVKRLKESGAVIIGKTNTCEFGQWPVTGSEERGYTRNPWSREHTPGGSSGGTAAAVGAGIVTAGLGSDGAGSIRIPAAWTHLVGIKPQRGRISTYPWREAFNGLTVNGPLARTVGDAAYLLEHTQGQHPDDINKPGTVPVSEAATREPGRLRIGVSRRPPITILPARLHKEIERALRQTAETLTRLGHHTEDREPGYHPIQGLSFLAYSLSALDDWRRVVPDEKLLDHRTLENARNGRLLRPTLKLAKRMEARAARSVSKAFHDLDVILAPTTAQPPLKVGAIDRTGGFGTDRVIIGACPYTWPWNLLGWPGINIPAGFTEDGLPIGVQLLGPSGSEPLLVSLAAQLENELAWHRHAPTRWW